MQRIELRLKSGVAGDVQVFWAPDHEGPFGGFEPSEAINIRVMGDGQWHEYGAWTWWDGAPQVIQLRVDPVAGRYEFGLEWVRLLEPATPITPSPSIDWDFTNPTEAALWTAAEGLESSSQGPEGLKLTSSAQLSLITACLAPGTQTGSYVLIEAATTGGPEIELDLTSTGEGRQTLLYPWPADGRLYTACLPITIRGDLRSVGVRPPRGTGSTFLLKRLAFVNEPAGQTSPRMLYFGKDSGVNRVGRPAKIVCNLANFGAEPAGQVRLVLQPGLGVRLAEGEQALREAGVIGYANRAEASWQVVADSPGIKQVGVEVTSEAGVFTSSAEVEFSPAPQGLPTTDYVPEPVPLKTDWEVGCYYFPGWATPDRWQSIKDYYRKPLLGYYAEGDPWIMDWQIKWARERGITFWIFDWYWNQGQRTLEHGLHEAFFGARYQDQMKFALLWANHNGPGSHSREDLLAACDFWIKNYFKRDNYLRIDGKPAIWIFQPMEIAKALGEEGTWAALEELRQKCRDAGLGGLYLVACGQPRESWLERMKALGFDADSDYNSAGLNTGGDLRAPYTQMNEDYQDLIERSAMAPGGPALPYIPSANCGWDSRAWHGYSTLWRVGYTPETLEAHLQALMDLVERTGVTGPAGKLIISEAWNEWGEGSICEPGREWGFTMLDAFQQALAPEAPKASDLVPADLGQPLREVEFSRATAWEFEEGLDGWTVGLSLELKPVGGALVGRAISQDPVLQGPPIQIQASEYRYVAIRMAVSGGEDPDGLQLFFSNSLTSGFSGANMLTRGVIRDGEYHTYLLEPASLPGWVGTITGLRFDPSWRPGAELKLDYIRLLKELPEEGL